jgi:hypothetical protein
MVIDSGSPVIPAVRFGSKRASQWWIIRLVARFRLVNVTRLTGPVRRPSLIKLFHLQGRNDVLGWSQGRQGFSHRYLGLGQLPFRFPQHSIRGGASAIPKDHRLDSLDLSQGLIPCLLVGSDGGSLSPGLGIGRGQEPPQSFLGECRIVEIEGVAVEFRSDERLTASGGFTPESCPKWIR